jgi:Ankyrin repeats (3 copies)
MNCLQKKLFGVLILFASAQIYAMDLQSSITAICSQATYTAIDGVRQHILSETSSLEKFIPYYNRFKEEYDESLVLSVIHQIQGHYTLSSEVIAVRLALPNSISWLKKQMQKSEVLSNLRLHLIDVCGEKTENVTVVQCLLDLGIEPNVVDGSSCHTPLINAATRGHENIVALLLSKGANVNGANWLDCTALTWACYNGHHAVVSQLIKAKADVNVKNNQTGSSILTVLTNEQNKNKSMANIMIVQLLRAAGAQEEPSKEPLVDTCL